MKEKKHQIISGTSKIDFFVSKTMNKFYSRNGTLLNNQEEILTETMNHFKSLYT